MSKISGLRYFYMCWMAKPVADRRIFKLIKRHKVKSIIEIGLEDGSRCEKMIAVAQKFSEVPVRYAGIDQFEGRSEDQAQVSLLETHKRLKKTGAKVKLIPGDAESATAKIANALTGTDLIVLSSDSDLDQLDRFWFYLPRMVHDQSLLLVKTKGNESETYKVFSQKDWQKWTDKSAQISKAA